MLDDAANDAVKEIANALPPTSLQSAFDKVIWMMLLFFVLHDAVTECHFL